jgi:predicted enzyme related to lactoylglutathione lyase
MGRVTGIGGVFFRYKDAAAQRDWYRDYLGLHIEYGTNFASRQADNPEAKGFTQWSPFKEKSEQFECQFIMNYRVEDLDDLLKSFADSGVEVIGEVVEETYRRFAHIRDPEGNRVELWEPKDEAYETMLIGVTK